jgi:hypothetical protein
MTLSLKKFWQGLVVASLLAVKTQQVVAAHAAPPSTQIEAKVAASTPNLDAVDFSSLRWNKAAQRYIGANGQYVSASRAREIVDGEIAAYGKRIEDAAQKLSELAASGTADNPISAAQWSAAVAEFRKTMREQMRLLHLSQLAAGNGGFHTLGAEEYGRVGGLLKKQLAYLEKFAQQLAQTPALALSPTFPQRAALYAEAGRATYERQRGIAHRKAGFKWERNVLADSANACAGCIRESTRGWVKIGSLVPIGLRDCIVRDRCTIEYSKDEPAIGTEKAREELKAKLAALGRSDVLELADMPADVMALWNPKPGTSTRVIVTGERREHYLAGHPGVADDWEPLLAEVIADPDFVHRSPKQSNTYEFYKRIEPDNYLMAPVRVQHEPGWRKHSVMSLYKVKVSRAERDREYRDWEKDPAE